ncbi:MAG TPA: hypothetical protein IAA17_00895, partial [Candidatus Lachnoclostridium stercorigallinarum]|nr:hypothetical protein [Candidatus Lachnoclostridium stercorigallinarum]
AQEEIYTKSAQEFYEKEGRVKGRGKGEKQVKYLDFFQIGQNDRRKKGAAAAGKYEFFPQTKATTKKEKIAILTVSGA